jgi:AraC family transcriptional regulator of adaptative response / DNA-3-methyladenine glycosylase II
MQSLDQKTCKRARLARDHRFDGEFFLAVTTTGIYCRPICPARPPREQNVRYYRTAAEAAHEGFRPCLRCRPESAPQSPAWRGTSTTVSRAMQLINEGYLSQHSLARLAERLGVGERYLRKLFQQQLGVAPSVVAQTQRLHFAQKLLLETSMSVTDIAYASGFGSVRRFNSASQQNFGCAPGALRRRRPVGPAHQGVTLELSYRPPYDWQSLLAFHQRHSIEGVEGVSGDTYWRNLRTPTGCAQIRISPHPRKPALTLELLTADSMEIMQVVATVRRMFDLDAQPDDIAECLGQDPMLEPLLLDRPGVRCPTVATVFESCVRAVLGQQVSTEAARRLCGKLLQACNSYLEQDGKPIAVFPLPEQLAALPDSALPMPASRRNTLRSICEYFSAASGEDQHQTLDDLSAMRGIGPWTIGMLAMRGFGDPDMFPLGDLGLVKAVESFEDLDQKALRQRADSWKPWRSYAANLLWRSLSQ